MPYDSVDQIQAALTEGVFTYAQDRKKAAGRALGTIVEIIAFYLMKSWGLQDSVSIERKVPEYGCPEITHNVEYTLHPILNHYDVGVENDGRTITPARILKSLEATISLARFEKTTNNLLTADGILRNACTIAGSDTSSLIATIDGIAKDRIAIKVIEQSNKPYSIFECKRVGVEEGTKKGPQTIEKAKQGAYVARSVSSLQKIKQKDGRILGAICINGKIETRPYTELLSEFIHKDNPDYLRDFVLTVGIVSNHGNWFTHEDHNKELKVLAQSYDWLLFLTDNGIIRFVQDLLLEPEPEYAAIQQAFLASYKEGKPGNQFTKVRMNYEADNKLVEYFTENLATIETWFNIITPANADLKTLKIEIDLLRQKNWREILK